jgi:hypothetical protein
MPGIRLSKHPYYCAPSGGNSQRYDGWEAFSKEWATADKDYNLLFRWDWSTADELHLFFIQQRHGVYLSVEVHGMTREDVDSVKDYLQDNFDYLKEVWGPLK